MLMIFCRFFDDPLGGGLESENEDIPPEQEEEDDDNDMEVPQPAVASVSDGKRRSDCIKAGVAKPSGAYDKFLTKGPSKSAPANPTAPIVPELNLDAPAGAAEAAVEAAEGRMLAAASTLEDPLPTTTMTEILPRQDAELWKLSMDDEIASFASK